MNSKIKTIEMEISGRVQGVFYRNSALNFAKSLRLTGIIKALPDGNVKIIAQGPEKRLKELLKWCQRGSLLSKVEGMSYKWIETEKIYKNFKLKRSGNFLKDKAKSFLNLGKRVKKEIKMDLNNIDTPEHVVIIPDGNRRWAKENGIETWKAYKIVGKKIDKFVDFAKNFQIKHLTLWGFSTENWKRQDKKELKELMKLFVNTIDRFHDLLLKEGVKFQHLGRKDRIPQKLVKKFQELEEVTSGFKQRTLNIAVDYGGRDEIIRAIDKLMKSNKNEVSEKIFSKFLDTSHLPDPDLIIRTSGEKRLSGFMPWQSVYSEFYFTNVYFPDFSYENFKDAIFEYSQRKRKFGGDSSKNKKYQNPSPKKIKNFSLNSLGN